MRAPRALQDRVEALLLDAFGNARGPWGTVVVSALGINGAPGDAWLPWLCEQWASPPE